MTVDTTHVGLELLCYTFLCVLVVAILVKLKLRRSAGLLNLPPGPWALPVIGHMHLLLGALPYRAMHRLARRHGPVMLLRLGHVPTLVLSSADAAREVMKVHDAAFADRPLFATADVFTYGGEDISFARHNSRHWKALRALCTVELLSPRRVRSFRPVREEEAARLVSFVAATSCVYGSGPVAVNVSEMLKVMMNDVVMRVSVGDRCPQRAAYLEELDKVVELMAGFNLTDLFPGSPLARALGAGSMRATWKAREKIQSIMDAMVEDHKRESTGHDKEDILTTLLRFQRDGGIGITLTDENVSGVLFVSHLHLGRFLAGSETTATTTIWAMSELMRNPRIMAIAQSEVRRLLQGKAKVAEADIDGQLYYLQMVIKETFRLHPPVPLLLPRLCTETTKIMGYDVAPGTTVFVNAHAIGRDNKSWTDASQFRPERFEGEKVDYGGTDFRFLPGGAGRRMCPGMMFGVFNIEIALASLLYHFNWRLPEGRNAEKLDMTETYGITARRKSDLLLEATITMP